MSAVVLTAESFVACPYCHAEPGESCVAIAFGPVRQPVGFVHVERIRAAA